MAKPAGKPRKKANGYKMPDPLPNGLIVQDLAKKKWKLGPSIGKGGFGEIYSAQECTDSPKSSKTFPFVVKIEPHENGPLFVEMHFYMRNAKSADIESFKTKNKLSSLGMPEYLGSGSHEHKGQKYRFVVMKKFGTDIWKLFTENKRSFPVATVFKVAVQILDVLEYIHSKGYIHADIKGANVLLGTGREEQTQVYLVDFGLCTHYASKYKPDPKKAHNGTIEYVSRDAHLGVETRRGDLEILGYNITQWLGCTLPWEKNLSDPVTVQQSKEKHMSNLPGFFKSCFGNEKPPGALLDYFKYIINLEADVDPDYKKLRKILVSGVEVAGGTISSPLKFKLSDSTPGKRKAAANATTPQKKTRTASKKLEVEESPSNEHLANGVKEEVDTKKKPKKKTKASKQKKEPDVEEGNTAGFTAEMLRIKERMNAKKKPQTEKVADSDRPLRNRKKVDYRSSGGRNSAGPYNVSTEVISDSEDEQVKLKMTTATGTKRRPIT